ncbi:MAG: hypothetical protein V3W19_15605 [Desulfatiglandales bacterium]
MCKINRVLLIILLVVSVCSLANAGDTPDSKKDSSPDPSATKDWEFSLAPFYFWAVNLDGDATVRGTTAPINLDFDEIFDTLEGLFTVHFEAWYRQKWGLLIDVSYINISDQQTTPGPTLDVDFENVITELGFFYRFFDKGPHQLEALAGIRYTDLDVEIDVVGVPLNTNGNQDWLDPMIGARYNWQISEKWHLSLRGDIGGFGIGDASDFTWNAVGLINWQPWKHVGFLGGYRAMNQDYETGSGLNKFAYDVLMQGPVLAVKFTW